MTPKYKINKDWRKRHPSTWQKSKSRYYKKSEEKAHNGRQCWTIQDIDLITNKDGKTDTEIAGLIGRSVKAIQIMRCRTNIIDHKHYRKGGIIMGNTARKLISEKILFSPKEEDPLTVANEIIAGTRPKKWDVAGHPDHDVWVSMIELQRQ